MWSMFLLEILVKETDIIFLTDHYQSSRYKNSPYFRGTVLWDLLPVDVILLPTLQEFKARI